MTIDEHIIANEVLREVNHLLENQTAKGLAKYGHTVNPDEYDLLGWMKHHREELLDALVYTTIQIRKLEGEKNATQRDSSETD